jgi:hypothetical protein
MRTQIASAFPQYKWQKQTDLKLLGCDELKSNKNSAGTTTKPSRFLHRLLERYQIEARGSETSYLWITGMPAMTQPEIDGA